MTDDDKNKAGAHGAPRDASMKVRAHPPTQFLGSCLGTVVLGTLVPLRITAPPRQTWTWVGVSGFIASVGLGFTAVSTFKRHKTPVPHGYRVQTIVKSGVFSVSRNPIYLGMVSAVVSLGVALNTWWGAAAAVYLAATIQRRVIPYEEAYLEETFGKEYQDYKAEIPRWILFF